MQLTHLDLFSGIGGFALAAKANGVRTVVFCENNHECCAFLEKSWGLPIVKDIRDFDGTKWRGHWLLTAGVPCQPASRAGKRRGKEDHRWLWPSALRVLEEAKPAWCIFENPPGIDDVGLDGILAQMERVGYEVQPFDIPACAIDSPQLRHRFWIVGRMQGDGHEAGLQQTWKAESGGGGQGGLEQQRITQGDVGLSKSGGFGIHGSASGSSRHADIPDENMAGPERKGLEKPVRQPKNPGEQCEATQRNPQLGVAGWSNYVWVPCADRKVRRAPDDSFVLVDGLHRSLLQALGNSIVWPVAAEIIRAMILAHQHFPIPEATMPGEQVAG